MSAEYENEPIRGLPGNLPEGEHILWQGSPEWPRLARDAFKIRWIAGYFAALMLWAVAAGGSATGMLLTLAVAAVSLGLLFGLAYLSARSTIYTITNKRIVLRFGVALPKCINLPMSAISGAGMKRNVDGSGDIPLELSQAHRLGYIQFWPHARPWKVARPQPMLRCVAGVEQVADILSKALAAAVPGGQRVAPQTTVAQPAGKLVAA